MSPLVINSITHFLVDGACCSALFAVTGMSSKNFAVLLMVYNTLAFSTQCIVGMAIDSVKPGPRLQIFSIVLIAAGAMMDMPFPIAIFCGIGNSLFHVYAGTVTLKNAGKSPADPGLFVAPGAIGVTLGTLYPALCPWFCAGLLIAAALTAISGVRQSEKWDLEDVSQAPAGPGASGLCIGLLAAAVAVRAIGGSAVTFGWADTAGKTILLTAAVFLGKCAGGFACGRIGEKKTAVVSLPLCAICLIFFSDVMLLSLAGQFLLNLTMPVTLWLMYRAMPDDPATAFGIAASALYPGTLAGQLFTLTGPAQGLCIGISIAFGLFAVLYAAGIISKSEK